MRIDAVDRVDAYGRLYALNEQYQAHMPRAHNETSNRQNMTVRLVRTFRWAGVATNKDENITGYFYHDYAGNKRFAINNQKICIPAGWVKM